MTGDRLRAAVIGTGFAGAQHAEALRRIGIDVAVVAASRPERAKAAADAFGVGRASDWATAATDPEVDVVHVCVPNDLHRDVALAAIHAGKHVICEKPLAMDLAQGLSLADAADRADRLTVLCHNYRFFPMVAELRVRIYDGALGRLHAIRGSYLQDWMLAREATNWRVDARRGGRSRVIADIGTHWVDLAETVTGRRLAGVLAQVATVHPQRPGYEHVETFTRAGDGGGAWVDVQTEDQAALLLRFDDGLPGSLFVSQVAAGHRNDLEISVDGAEGSARWRQEQPDELWLSRGGVSEVIPRSPTGLARGVDRLAHLPGGHNEGWADALRNLIAAAYAQIAGVRDPQEATAAPLPTFADGVRHLAFVEAALRSAETERWVSIDEVMALAQAGAEPS